MPCGGMVQPVLAGSSARLRVLETASPPTYYLPSQDVDWTLLVRTTGSSYCEGKAWRHTGRASDLAAGGVALSHGEPNECFAAIDGCVFPLLSRPS
jgi:uncharacterized protein (DUF427 family)